MTITLISVVVAVLVSGIELLGLFGDQLSLAGDFWTAMGRLNDNFGTIGYALIALFVLSWLASWLVERVRG
jgi:high-affinity nickel-transport protein